VSRSYFSKLFIGFLVVGILPYAWLLYFSYEESKRVVMNQIRHSLQNSIAVVVKKIESDIENMQSDLHFLSQLELFDEILTHDADKQLQNILEKKIETAPFIASLKLQNQDKEEIVSLLSGVSKETLYINEKIVASFDTQKVIGILSISFGIDAFKSYLPIQDDYWIIVPKANIRNQNQSVRFKHPLLSAYALEVYINESHHLAPLEKSQFRFILFSAFGLGLLLLFALFVGRKVVAPIERLASSSQAILQSDDTSKRIELQSDDELGQLTQNFNTMLDQEAQYLRLLEEAKYANETKARFISQISHEFRTPLNSIIGFSQVLDRENLVEKEYAKLPRNIEKAGKKLLTMINDLLLLSAQKHESFIPPKTHFNVYEFMNDIVMLLESQALKKGLILRSEISLSLELYADQRVLEQILINLISNAIKYTESGSVTLSLHLEEAYAIFSVKDSGIGITKAEQEKLFIPFSRIERGMAMQKEGSGLGLALVMEYCKSIDAKLELISEGVDMGSEFIIKVRR
jgi:signal transduction histidine kinase